MTILVLFTFGISLKTWKEKGLIDRELEYYRKLVQKYNFKFVFLTYGDESDLFLKEKNIEIYPLYSKFRKPNSIFIAIIHSILFPIFAFKEFSKIDIIKTNQMLGSWIGVILSKILKKPLILRSGYELYDFAIKAIIIFIYGFFKSIR